MSKEDKKLPFNEHFAELRKRIILSLVFFGISLCASYFFSQEIYQFLVQPLADAYEGQERRRLIFTGLTEAFFTYLKVSFYAALFVSFPFFAIQLYLFLAPGLYKNERRVLLPFLFATPILFVLGGAIVYYFVFPLAWQFFLSFESVPQQGSLPVQLEAKVSEYLSLVIQLVLAFGLAFQLPVLLNLLARVGLLTSDVLREKRKYAIVIIVIFAAVITPPDVISQIGLALGMLLLYEFSIISCKWTEKDKKKGIKNNA